MTRSKIALITGGSRGIGAACAELFVRAGYAVALTYVSDATAAGRVVDANTRPGGRAIAIRADVALEPEILRAFEQCDRAFGPPGVLVNNAGITGSMSRLDAVATATLDRVFAVNITGAFLCAREAVKRMSTRHGGAGGAIINVSSRAAQLGGPGEWVHYAASKGAIDSMTIGLAREVGAEGIRVNAVAPGLIDTEIHAAAGAYDRVVRLAAGTPLGRGGTALEVAEAILWLASDAASYVNGAIVPVGGGR